MPVGSKSLCLFVLTILLLWLAPRAATLAPDPLTVWEKDNSRALQDAFPELADAEVQVRLLARPQLTPYLAPAYRLVWPNFTPAHWVTSGQLRSRLVLPVQVWQAQHLVNQINSPVQVLAWKKVAVSKRFIKKGEQISTRNTRLATRNLTLLPPKIFFDLTILPAYEARYDIVANRVLTGSNLRQRPLIRNGTPVKIRFRSSGIIAEAEGVARADGYPGQPLRVQNTQSKKYLEGIVVDRYTVEINY
jgi:flagella basal body P-ring formation protein FlgA